MITIYIHNIVYKFDAIISSYKLVNRLLINPIVVSVENRFGYIQTFHFKLPAQVKLTLLSHFICDAKT